METKLRILIIIATAINAFFVFEPVLETTLSYYFFLALYIGCIFYFLMFSSEKLSYIYLEIIATLSTIRILNFCILILNDCAFFF